MHGQQHINKIEVYGNVLYGMRLCGQTSRWNILSPVLN